MPRDANSSRSELRDRALWLLLTAAGVVALAAPAQLAAWPPPCLFRSLGFEHCWGCGITRAILALLHGNWRSAWEHNALVFVVLPLLGFLYLRFSARVWRGAR